MSLTRLFICSTSSPFSQANSDVRQLVIVSPDLEAKFTWLSQLLPTFLAAGPLLVFVSTKAGCEQVATRLQSLGRKGV